MKIAQRMQDIDSSGIRRVFDLAASLKDPVNLSIGQPHFPVPESLKQGLITAVQEDRNGYTRTQGIADLCARVRERYRSLYDFQSESVMITSGVSGGLLLAFMVLLDPGDEVLIPDPYFVMYPHLARLAGGKPVYYNTYPDFRINEQQIRSCITERTRFILVNSPNNPTGAVLPGEDLKMIVRMADEHGLVILSDEIYDEFSYDGAFTSMAECTDKALILNGFSKSSAVTGWRVGYALGPDQIIKEMIKLQQYTFVCAPSMVQYAMLQYSQTDPSIFMRDYRKKRDMIFEGLSGSFKLIKPGGAFYAFPKVPEKYSSATEFVTEAVKKNLLIIPGNVFSEKDTHFRLSFAAEEEVLKRGIGILNSLA